MTMETAFEYRRSASRCATQVERTCIVLLQSELDIAFGFLRLAEVETGSGKAAHAEELIAKASGSYQTVLEGLGNVPLEFEEERQLLREGVRMLEDAIRGVVRRRQQDARLH